MLFTNINHIAIICSDYQRSKQFYVNILGFTILNEVYREERNSYKLALALKGAYTIELFSFENPPERPSYPEATGLRHLAFSVEDIYEVVKYLESYDVKVEDVRTDPHTGRKFTFFADPDGLPIEICEE